MEFKNENNLESAVSAEKEKIRVDKIHLLIHPGFLLHDFERENMPEADQYSPLLDMYIAKAETVARTPNELMVIFVPRTWSEMKTDITEGRKNLVKLQTIKKILGRRAIFISDNHSPVSGDTSSVINLVKQLAEKRGFQIENTVSSDAYGEWFNACVTDGSVKLNQAAGWHKKTTLHPGLSDFAVSETPQEDLDAYMRRANVNLVGKINANDFVEISVPDTWDKAK